MTKSSTGIKLYKSRSHISNIPHMSHVIANKISTIHFLTCDTQLVLRLAPVGSIRSRWVVQLGPSDPGWPRSYKSTWVGGWDGVGPPNPSWTTPIRVWRSIYSKEKGRGWGEKKREKREELLHREWEEDILYTWQEAEMVHNDGRNINCQWALEAISLGGRYKIDVFPHSYNSSQGIVDVKFHFMSKHTVHVTWLWCANNHMVAWRCEVCPRPHPNSRSG